MPPTADVAQLLLNKAYSALQPPLPPVSMVSHGRPAIDLCREDRLVVWVENMPVRQSRGARGNRRTMTQSRVVYHLDIYRCAPGLKEGGRPPTMDEEQTLAQLLLDDIDQIRRKVMSEADDVFGISPMVEWGVAVPLGPLGYVAGWSWPINYGHNPN